MPTVTTAPPATLTQHVVPFAPPAGRDASHVIAARFLKNVPALIHADGSASLGAPGETRTIDLHGKAGALVATSAGDRIITGGGDGRVVALDHDGTTTEIACDPKGAWIDAVAVTGDAIAWSAAKRVTARDDKGAIKTFEASGSVMGLAFAPKGYRLAMAHYNGVTLWYPNTTTPTQFLEWKGAHFDVTISPDGRFVVSAMQENALHGWRLSAKPGEKPAHMRMSGYPAKSRSLSWSHDGAWLATSGAEAVIIWPFADDGPMGKAPRECGVRRARVTQVAFHPAAYVIAAGYDDGCIMLLRLTDGSELVARTAVTGTTEKGLTIQGSAVTALAWEPKGQRLLFGCEDGQAGVLTLPTGGAR